MYGVINAGPVSLYAQFFVGSRKFTDGGQSGKGLTDENLLYASMFSGAMRQRVLLLCVVFLSAIAAIATISMAQQGNSFSDPSYDSQTLWQILQRDREDIDRL